MATTTTKPLRQTVRIPLVGTYNQRTIDGEASLTANLDQRFKNCTFDVVKNPVSGTDTIYVEKRPGWATDLIVDDGEASTGLIRPQSFNATISAFGGVNSTIYRGTTDLGDITGRAEHFTETIVGTTTYIMIMSSDSTGWYFAEDAADQTSYTGDTNSNATIDNIADTAGMYSGQAISGTDIPAGARILTVDSSTQITMDTSATGTTAGVTITKTPIAQILDADFIGTGTKSAFVEMDGFLFYTDSDDGRLWNSELNSVADWPALGFLSTLMSPDPPRALARYKDKVIVLGGASKEVFTNVDNETGSPLQRESQFFDRYGTLHQRSVTTFENQIFFVSSPVHGDVGVYKIENLETKKISTPIVDRIIGTSLATEGAIFASSFRLGGYPYLGLFISSGSEEAESLLQETGDQLLLESGDEILLEGDPASVESFVRFMVYNVELNIWSEWDAALATFITGSVAVSSNQIVATSRAVTDGKIYKIDASQPVYQDDGTSYTTEIRTSKVDFGTNKRKFIHKIRLVCDQDSTGEVSLSWSDDDYATYSTARTLILNRNDPQFSACGSHVGGRVYKLQHSGNGPFRAEALEITYSEAVR